MKHDKGVQGVKFLNNVYEFHEGFIVGKSHRQLVHVQLFRPCVNTLNVFVHMNVCGPMSTPSINGGQFFVLFKDDHFSLHLIHNIKHKFEIFSCFYESLLFYK